ncbi:uncharacterized protein LOC18424544 isoform X3 [Amborella trichopoda]|uniref:uncharacterized protein LOC18424544 isoform X3 n=1 Tax=Amborella trichopoda TaxID=13333 RepID=UPI0009C03084|nr:uncharacterized protein LOC18424544 isoform X3 [Amborella trichopoda]|eukprot:XP_020517321.1 uncharacterized protein LOC18424544 isoform X3 [Amborella trichopoda]
MIGGGVVLNLSQVHHHGLCRVSWQVDRGQTPIITTKPTAKPSKIEKQKPRPALLPQKNGAPSSPNLRAHVSELLSLPHHETQGKSEDAYLGYERWLPAAPNVKTPRSRYKAAALAYMGDCIFEFYARRHFLFTPLSIDEYNARVMAIVRCESQDILLKLLLADGNLSEEERDVLRWGRNIGSGRRRGMKRVGVAAYNRASSLETLTQHSTLSTKRQESSIIVVIIFIRGNIIFTTKTNSLDRSEMRPGTASGRSGPIQPF